MGKVYKSQSAAAPTLKESRPEQDFSEYSILLGFYTSIVVMVLMLLCVAAILNHRQRAVPCNPGINRGVPGLCGVQQLEDDRVLVGPDVLLEFSQRDFLVAHRQLPPEAHQLPAFVLIEVIGKA